MLESFLRDNRQVFANSTAELGRSSTMQHGATPEHGVYAVSE